VELGMGIEPQGSRRYRHLGFFSAASLPLFSLLGNSASQVKKSLVGDEQIEWNGNQLSILRQSIAWRVREQSGAFDSREHQMSKVWKQEALERRNKATSDWGTATLLVQELLLSIFCLVVKSDSLLFSLSALEFVEEAAL